MHLAHPRAQLAGLSEDGVRVASDQLARSRGCSVRVRVRVRVRVYVRKRSIYMQ